jgi:5-aminolevulinate synthase
MTTEIMDYTSILAEKINTLKGEGNYRYFLPVSKSAETHPVFFKNTEGGMRSIVNWTSNDYLGLSADEDVINAFVEAAKHDGIGSGGTRNISGTTVRHILLEKTLAHLHQKQAALVFSSAYLANSATLATLAKAFPDTLILSDAENHASMIEGIKLSRCDKQIFRHNDVAHLEALLQQTDIDRPKIIAFESVYSMSGTTAPIKAICNLAKKYNALTYIDEVHAVGLYGEHGEGLAATVGCANDIDVINGTLSKSFGCIGGYIVGNATLIDYIRSYGEGFIFTTSLPPSVCAAATRSVEKSSKSPELRYTMHQNVAFLRQLLKNEGINYEGEKTHITRIIIGNAAKTKQVCDRLLNEFSIYLQPINFPTVPRGKEGLRIIATARHTAEQVQALVHALTLVLS